jgi:hypothetical protein
MDINLNDLLRRYRSHPYEDCRVETPHTGILTFSVEEGQAVECRGGQLMNRPGTLLFLLEREKNVKKVTAPCRGRVTHMRADLHNQFVEAGLNVLSIQHHLGKDEIIDRILKQVLSVLPAPQRARYFLAPEIAAKLEKAPRDEVSLQPGDEVLIMSLMKRDTSIDYDGVPGVIYKVYFQPGGMVEQGDPLLGVCPPEKLQYVQKMIQRIRSEWEE